MPGDTQGQEEIPRLLAPENGVTVRMYRPGHGDCFLLAFATDDPDEPFYVLIDCGYKPGSQRFVGLESIGEIVDHIRGATGGRIDLFVVTHEHQDHVNGIWKKIDPYFGTFDIHESWMAWCESPSDPMAIRLRAKYGDQLARLVAARNQLAARGFGVGAPQARQLDSLLGLELGGEEENLEIESMRGLLGADGDPDPNNSPNKRGILLVKERAATHRGSQFLEPGGAPHDLVGARGVRAYVLGPPRDEKLLQDEDPVGDEAFPGEDGAHHFTFSAAAHRDEDAAEKLVPFDEVYAVAEAGAAEALPSVRDHYVGQGEAEDDDPTDGSEVSDTAAWRRIDTEWLYTAEALALKLNRGINNTSLVLAFELPKTKKILLFVGDAQRGNWISWDDHTWEADGATLTARDILARTVLYKVGHHGSHNATLHGKADSDYPNLSWMAQGDAAAEFTAMIPAVEPWCQEKTSPPWRHPLPSIWDALLEKAEGRVFRSDRPKLEKPAGVSKTTWNQFLARSAFEKLYFDLTVRDS